MRNRDDLGRLQDVLDAIIRIESYMQATTEKEFADDLMRQDAVIRQIEIIGEAGRNVSAEFQERHPEIPWSKLIGMRNKIAHDYAEVDIPTVWDTVKNDLPSLKEAVSKVLKES